MKVSEIRELSVDELHTREKDLVQRVARIAVTHACDEAARHAQGEAGVEARQDAFGQIFQADQREQLARIGHGVAPQASPVLILRVADSRTRGLAGMRSQRVPGYNCCFNFSHILQF